MLPEWIVSALRQRADANSRTRLGTWREASARNDQRWRTLGRLWRATGTAERPVRTRPPSADFIIGRAGTRPSRPGRRLWPVGGAAVAVAAAAALIVVGLVSGRETPVPLEHITGPGEVATVRLGDGSIVRLGEESRLRVVSGDTRSVWLEGRAFLAITSQPEHPFTVSTPAGRVRVLGTRFTLRTAADTLDVAVVEGRVALIGTEGEHEVGAGQTSAIVRGAVTPALPAPDIATEVAWLGTTIILEETPLRAAAEEVRRVHGITMVIPDPAVGRRTVTAVFTSSDGDAVVATLCRAASVRCDRTGMEVLVLADPR